MSWTGHDRIWSKLCLLAFFTVALATHAPRRRRQLGEEPSGPPIDLNTTVPYIFSARLYPYGLEKGDKILTNSAQAMALMEPFAYLGAVYDTIYIRNDGAVSLSPENQQPSVLPSQHPIIAAFWMPTRGGKVYYRQTDDQSLLNMAHNEVNIQYRYGQIFNIRSVVVITWEGGRDASRPNIDGNVFQLAIIIGDEMTFAHFIYSRLISNRDAVAGFSNGANITFSLPDSGTADSILLREKSDIGIPGEWLFRIDATEVYLCGAGFKGLECVESCSPNQWFNDCSRSCHCENGDQCDPENGRCPTTKCTPGWTHPPICDRDIDECAQPGICPAAQPDCVNTPGAFMCLCFEYDEELGRCKGSELVTDEAPEVASVPVQVMPVHPSIHSHTTKGPAHTRARAHAVKQTTSAPSSKKANTTKKTTATSRSTTSASDSSVVIQPPIPPLAPNCPLCHPRAECVAGRCDCLPGYEGDGQFSCEDINECARTTPCGDRAKCENIDGSYECTCDQGYRYDGQKCVDKDECSEGSVCGEGVGAECVNTEGSFVCKCGDGYQGSPFSADGCQDMDECQHDACGEHATCTNTKGGFECECHEGFERSNDDAFCTDIDECLQSPCHAAAQCTNLAGSFTCDCIEGFIGDGVDCHETILYPIANDSFVVPRGNSSASFSLSAPVKVGGEEYLHVKVSPQGYFSFTRHQFGHEAEIDGPAIFVYNSDFDYSSDGLVAFTRVNDSDEASRALLRRAALSASAQWGIDDFEPTHLQIITFSRMRKRNSNQEELNSFQAVIASSPAMTLLTLLYEKLNLSGAKTAFVVNGETFEFVPDALATQSNVGQPGKWMLRIDTEMPGQCPAGRRRPPLCEMDCVAGRWGESCGQRCHCAGGLPCDVISGICVNGACTPGYEGPNCNQDINECATGILKCQPNANCINHVGSAECICAKGFEGNGTHCEATGRCLSYHNRPCSHDATCVDVHAVPVCQCRPGFHGDGFVCDKLTKDAEKPVVRKIQVSSSSEESEDRPFVMKEWEQATVPTPIIKQIPVELPPAVATIVTGKNGKKKPLPASAEEDLMDRNLVQVHEKSEDMEGDPSVWIFVVAPCVLAGVWIILIAALIGFCYKAHIIQRFSRRPTQRDAWRPCSQPTRRTSQTITYNHRAYQGYV